MPFLGGGGGVIGPAQYVGLEPERERRRIGDGAQQRAPAVIIAVLRGRRPEIGARLERRHALGVLAERAFHRRQRLVHPENAGGHVVIDQQGHGRVLSDPGPVRVRMPRTRIMGRALPDLFDRPFYWLGTVAASGAASGLVGRRTATPIGAPFSFSNWAAGLKPRIACG